MKQHSGHCERLETALENLAELGEITRSWAIDGLDKEESVKVQYEINSQNASGFECTCPSPDCQAKG